eukprot:3427599-Rhodomonas_salina.2
MMRIVLAGSGVCPARPAATPPAFQNATMGLEDCRLLDVCGFLVVSHEPRLIWVNPTERGLAYLCPETLSAVCELDLYVTLFDSSEASPFRGALVTARMFAACWCRHCPRLLKSLTDSVGDQVGQRPVGTRWHHPESGADLPCARSGCSLLLSPRSVLAPAPPRGLSLQPSYPCPGREPVDVEVTSQCWAEMYQSFSVVSTVLPAPSYPHWQCVAFPPLPSCCLSWPVECSRCQLAPIHPRIALVLVEEAAQQPRAELVVALRLVCLPPSCPTACPACAFPWQQVIARPRPGPVEHVPLVPCRWRARTRVPLRPVPAVRSGQPWTLPMVIGPRSPQQPAHCAPPMTSVGQLVPQPLLWLRRRFVRPWPPVCRAPSRFQLAVLTYHPPLPGCS